MLNNLFISSDEFYLDMFRKHKDEFSDLIIFWLFQISINSNCWEEAIDILENYKIFEDDDMFTWHGRIKSKKSYF